jgi:group I intron endonuclease
MKAKQYVVYQIRNMVNEKVYVGSTDNFLKRKKAHLYFLRHGSRKAPQTLLEEFKFYGENSFEFSVLRYIKDNEVQELDRIENDYIISMDARNPEKGYNKILVNNNSTKPKSSSQCISEGIRDSYLFRAPSNLKRITEEEWIENRRNDNNFRVSVYQKKGTLTRPIKQIDPATFQVIGTFNSAVEANNQTEVRVNKISDCINRNTFGREYLTKSSGFIWVAEDNFPKDFDFTIYKGKKRPHSGGRISKPKPPVIPKNNVSIHNEAGEVREFSTDKGIADFLGVKPSRITELKRGYKDKGGGRQSRISQVKGWQWGSVPSLQMA